MFYANFWFLNSLCTLSYTSQKCFCILCSLVTKILKNVVILFSKTWPDKTKSSNIMCIWCLKARKNLKILIWHKSFVHPIPVCLLEFNKVGCTSFISKGFKDTSCQSWYIVRGDWDSNLGRQKWYGPNSPGSSPCHRELCTNFDKLYLWSPLRHKDVLYIFRNLKSSSILSQLRKSIALI